MLSKLRKLIKKSLTRCDCIGNNEELKKQIKEYLNYNAILIDVRSPQEYKEGHIKGAILIPDYEIYIKGKNISKDKKQIIILYCNTGKRSKNAGKILKAQGYSNIYNICNGINKL